MNTKKEENVLGQGVRTSSPRRSGVTVPGSAASSSNDGLPDTCPADVSGEPASAKTDFGDSSKSRLWADGSSPSRSPSPSVLMPPPRGQLLFGFAREEPLARSRPSRLTETEAISVEDEYGDDDVEMSSIYRSSSEATLAGSENSTYVSGLDTIPPAEDKVPPKKKGRGRPPTTGKYVGLGRAQEEGKRKRAIAEEIRFREMQTSEEEHFAEEEEGRTAAKKKRAERQKSREFLKEGPKDNTPVEELSVPEMADKIVDALRAVKEVATKSGHLKGGYVKALNTATAAIKEAAEEVKERAQRDEEAARNARLLVRIRAENKQLSEELRELRAELAGLKASHAAASPPGKATLAGAKVRRSSRRGHPGGDGGRCWRGR